MNDGPSADGGLIFTPLGLPTDEASMSSALQKSEFLPRFELTTCQLANRRSNQLSHPYSIITNIGVSVWWHVLQPTSST